MSSDVANAYERWGRALVRKAQRVLRSRDDAEDIVHALFSDMLSEKDIPADLPYLYRAVTNRCLTLLRDETNRARIARENSKVSDLGMGAAPRTEEKVVDGDLLLRLVRTLNEEENQILVYRFFDDMTLEEIAELTGLSRKTVSKRLDDVRAVIERLGAASGEAPS